jgi:hypothetical protein
MYGRRREKIDVNLYCMATDEDPLDTVSGNARWTSRLARVHCSSRDQRSGRSLHFGW